MGDKIDFTTQEKDTSMTLYNLLRKEIATSLREGDEEKMRQKITCLIESKELQRDVFGLNPVMLAFQTAKLIVEEIGLKRDAVLSVLLNPCVECGLITPEETEKEFGTAVFRILRGLKRIKELYLKNPVI